MIAPLNILRNTRYRITLFIFKVGVKTSRITDDHSPKGSSNPCSNIPCQGDARTYLLVMSPPIYVKASTAAINKHYCSTAILASSVRGGLHLRSNISFSMVFWGFNFSSRSSSNSCNPTPVKADVLTCGADSDPN